MYNKQQIDEIFNILIQFEKIGNPLSNVTEDSYRNYLDRLNVCYLGYGRADIACAIKGLGELGASAQHDTVKRIVFHIIDTIKKGG